MCRVVVVLVGDGDVMEYGGGVCRVVVCVGWWWWWWVMVM